ncbi:MAG: hypothetical protein PHS15_01360 [Clostridiaceae bacterium]|nr:hypothetical protein [Clostridiaceae bacterium]
MDSGFQGWWERINGLIKKMLVLLFALLIVSQALLMNQAAKTFISRTDKLEGKSISDTNLFIKKGEIEISIENYSTLTPLVFYVNGDSVNTPAGKSIKLQVKNNDVVEVSGVEFNDTAILKVTAVSDNIIVPELGKLIYVNKNLEMVDRVRIK